MVRRAQADIIAAEPRASGCDVPPEKSHLTAFVLALNSSDDIAKAQQALRACSSLLVDGAAPRVRLRGLGAFRRDVIFAQIEASPDSRRVAHLVSECARIFMQHLGADVFDGCLGTWTAHLTLLKTSRVKMYGKRPVGSKPTLPTLEQLASSGTGLFADHADANGVVGDLGGLDFGTHELGSLELCAMAGLGEAGYYPVLEQVPIGT